MLWKHFKLTHFILNFILIWMTFVLQSFPMVHIYTYIHVIYTIQIYIDHVLYLDLSAFQNELRLSVEHSAFHYSHRTIKHNDLWRMNFVIRLHISDIGIGWRKLPLDEKSAAWHMDPSASIELQGSKYKISCCRLGEITWIWYWSADCWNVWSSFYCS